MAVSIECFAPNEALSLISPLLGPSGLGVYNGLAGEFAERLIEVDYLGQRGGRFLVEHYFDNPSNMTYFLFLAAKNQHLMNARDLGTLYVLSNLPDAGIKRPDILTDDRQRWKEYYEIKPDGHSGTTAGRLKIGIIDAFYGIFDLPYRRGATYTPRSRIPFPIPDLTSLSPRLSTGLQLDGFLSVRRSEPGLIQYKFCVQADWEMIARAVGYAAGIVVACIIIIVVANRLRRPIPNQLPNVLTREARGQSSNIPTPRPPPVGADGGQS